MNTEKIIIIDFGGPYTQLAARRIRECGVYCEILPYDTENTHFITDTVKGIILSGTIDTLSCDAVPSCSIPVFELGIPVFGIGYGMKLMVHALGGTIAAAQASEYGTIPLSVQTEDTGGLFNGLPHTSAVRMLPQAAVTQVPAGFTVLAATDNCPYAAIADIPNRLYAVQFHPEAAESEYGTHILNNFLKNVCGCQGSWNVEHAAESLIAEIRAKVGNKKVLSALSGGVDSSVASVLVHKAVGEQLTCIFVDHGLLRKNEAAEVLQAYRENLGLHIIHVDASERFLKRLQGVTEPERKRKIIGEEFIRVFEEEAKKIGAVDFLVQGTIYPDVIESGASKKAAVIKSHHNVGGLPEHVDFKELIEPLRMLFKDEVRALGRSLGIPPHLVNRQPFPGPGLAVRVLGEVTEERLRLVRESDAILREEIAAAGLDQSIWQYFTIVPNVRTVGVTEAGRTYDELIAIRAITSTDAMTGSPAEIPYHILQRIAVRIVKEVQGINRVVYDITPKPPATIEWE